MRLHLWIDADDTLWENNVFFERAFSEFADYLNHSRHSLEEVRAILDEIENVNNRIHGYGAANFARNLEQCFDKLCERPVTDEDRDHIRKLGADLAEHPMEIIGGVAETLEYLAPRHDLMMFTKGNMAEQQAKVDRSGLTAYFKHIHIVKEKDAATYVAAVAAREADPEHTWMIGNSPKSDINPALAAGIGAVYVPHPRTWHLEQEPVPAPHGRLLIVESFVELCRHF